MRTSIEKLAQANSGKLPDHAWPGGYPMYYVDTGNYELCPVCANKNFVAVDGNEEIKPVDYGIHFEGPPIECSQCNTRIESAYGDPAKEGKK